MSAKAFDPRPRQGLGGPRLGRIHDRVLHILAEVDAGAPADKAISNAFRRGKDLGSSERSQVREEVFGLLRYRRKTTDTLKRASEALNKKLDLLDKPIQLRMEVLTYLLLNGAEIADIELRDSYAAKRIPRLFERIKQGRLGKLTSNQIEKDAIDASLPTWLYRRLLDGHGRERAHEIGQALLKRAPVTLRVDPRYLERDAFLEKLHAQGIDAQPTPISPWGIILGQHKDLKDWTEVQKRWVEPQDEGSQLIAMALNPQPNERILDACAGAGGKTLPIWSQMNAQGSVVAIEPDTKKRQALQARLKAYGVSSIQIESCQLEELPNRYHNMFDRVLVDAPCSGTGTLRRHPDIKWRLQETELPAQVLQQSRLLGVALSATKPGGLIIYATCSVLREENEGVVEHIIKIAKDLEPEPLAHTLGLEVSKQLGMNTYGYIGPGSQENGPDGFFIAAFRKKSS